MTRFFLFLFISIYCQISFASNLNQRDSTVNDSSKSFFRKVPYKQLIAPVGLMTYGIIALENHVLLNNNQEINEELHETNHSKFTIDNATQYLPTAAVYGLDIAGVPAKHNLKFRLTASAISNLIMASTVYTIKETGTVWRPDHSNQRSFPSGHTATAFVGAEQLWQEYRDESIWYGIAGYAVASGTGFFRMYNNRHWFSDVAMGAGIGIMSTKIAYWITPLIVKNSNNIKQHKISFIAAPNYDGKHIGFSSQLQF